MRSLFSSSDISTDAYVVTVPVSCDVCDFVLADLNDSSASSEILTPRKFQ